VLLVSDAADPLLARWQFGLGRAVAWTSDLRGRWSQDWLQWSGTAQLFSSMVDWAISPARGPLHVSLRADAQAGHVTVEDTDAAPATTAGAVHVHVAQPGGAAVELELTPTGPGEYAGAFPLVGPGSYIVHVDERRDGASVGSAEAGLPVAYPAEFRQVTPDTNRMRQIATAGGGRVLPTPGDAFGQDLPPVTTSLPLQRALVLIAAILLPLEIGVRRLRLSWTDVWDWVRHPHRVALAFPRWSRDLPLHTPAWMPGAWKSRPAPPPFVWRARTMETNLSGHVTPGLARESDDGVPADEDDALGATLRWLAARRGTRGDAG
jgi:hypothetical protein